MNNTSWVHPEARLEVIKEYHRLRKSHPTIDGEVLWAMSRDYAWTVALAESSILRCEMALGSSL